MNLFEKEIAKYERRIGKISGKRDPSKLRSNVLFYRMELERRKKQLEAWEVGKPFALGAHAHQVLRAMGFEFLDDSMLSDRVGDEGIRQYYSKIRALGLPEFACDRTVCCVPMSILGDVPPPSFVVATNASCENLTSGFLYLAFAILADVQSKSLPAPFLSRPRRVG